VTDGASTPSRPGIAVGADDIPRCAWAASAPDYVDYHDLEWGRPVHGESALFEGEAP